MGWGGSHWRHKGACTGLPKAAVGGPGLPGPQEQVTAKEGCLTQLRVSQVTGHGCYLLFQKGHLGVGNAQYSGPIVSWDTRALAPTLRVALLWDSADRTLDTRQVPQYRSKDAPGSGKTEEGTQTTSAAPVPGAARNGACSSQEGSLRPASLVSGEEVQVYDKDDLGSPHRSGFLRPHRLEITTKGELTWFVEGTDNSFSTVHLVPSAMKPAFYRCSAQHYHWEEPSSRGLRCYAALSQF